MQKNLRNSFRVFIQKYKHQFVILLLITIGIATLFLAKAASNVSSVEPELGTINGPATSLTDSSASGTKAVKFSSTSGTSDSWPSPNDYKVCGNTSILNGPTSAPQGSITINPGTDLAVATANAAPGTTFYLTKGTHTLPTTYVSSKTGNTYIGAPGAVLDGQYGAANDSTRITAIRGGNNVTIKNLTITRFGAANGLMDAMVNQTAINWGQGANWTISNNTISYNGGAGVWAGDNGVVTNNCIEYNEQTGVNSPSKGSDYSQHYNVLIEGNEISNNNRTGSIEGHGCTGCAGGLKIWNTKNITLRNNNVHNNNGNGIWVDNNNIDVMIDHNVSKDNTKRGIFYEISYSAIIKNNYLTGNYVSGKGGVNNPAIYVSESGGDQATADYLGSDQTKFPVELNIYNNYLVDNWHGITLWESATRYCSTFIQGNPNGTNRNDTKWCPPILQGKNDTDLAAGRAICVNDLANNADLCRWKTKNVKVHNNKFEMTTAASTWCAPTNTGCANMAITASTDAPAGTPYAGTTVQTNISKNQNNKFYNNTYIGTWNFYIPNAIVSRNTWQTTWGQDSGSQFN